MAQQRLRQQQARHQPQLIAFEAIGGGPGAIKISVCQRGYAFSVLEDGEVDRHDARVSHPDFAFLEPAISSTSA